MFLSLLRCRAGSSAFQYSHPLRRAATFGHSRSFFQSNATFRAPLRPSKALLNEAESKIPSLKQELRRTRPEPSFSDNVVKPGIARQVLFVGVVTFLGFGFAAAQTDIATAYWKKRLLEADPDFIFKKITSLDLKRLQNREIFRELKATYASLNEFVQQLPALIKPWVGLAFVSVLQPYADASEGKRLCWKICLFNAGIYIAWQFRALNPLMNMAFMHNPLSRRSLTLLTSMFSHKSFFHLLLNCLALESFGSAAYYHLTVRQAQAEPPTLESTGSYHFLAFFVAAGLFSGLVSHVVAVKFMYPRIVAKIAAAARTAPKTDTWAAAAAAATSGAAKATKDAVPRILPSLGASGAIYAAVTLTALAFPNSEIALFIPPSYPIPIQTGVCALLAIDVLGVLRGWRMFDHWAHLGGAAFGVLYYHYGPSFWHELRQPVETTDSVYK